jgi:hypothetical protein
MIPDTGTAILVLAIFVLPGFITLVFRERLYVVKGDDSPFERLLQALYNSALVYGIAIGGGLLFGLRKQNLVDLHKGTASLRDDFLVAIGLFLPLPLLLAVLGSMWNSSKRLRPALLGLVGSSDAHSVLSGWNELFTKQGGALLRVKLSDGRVVGGFYGEDSLAGNSHHTQDLYISQRWELDEDDWFVKPADWSLGFWLPRESIVSLEVYASTDPNDAGDPVPFGLLKRFWRRVRGVR